MKIFNRPFKTEEASIEIDFLLKLLPWIEILVKDSGENHRKVASRYEADIRERIRFLTESATAPGRNANEKTLLRDGVKLEGSSIEV